MLALCGDMERIDSQERAVVFIFKSDLSDVPLNITVLKSMQALGVRCTILCGSCSKELRVILENELTIIHALQEHAATRQRGMIGKSIFWGSFNRFIKSHLRLLSKKAVLWISGGDTALALFDVLNKRRFVLQLHELYDTLPLYRYGLKRIARHAAVVVCPEPTRAAILQVYLSLPRRAVVLPNKPWVEKDNYTSGVALEAVNLIRERVGQRKILLYQGHVSEERSPLVYAEAIRKISDKWAFVVMGKFHDATLENVKKACPKVLTVPFIRAPHHLCVTAMATVGIIKYAPCSLNNVFCAPNKIWEYGAFGVPFIGNTLPTLENILRDFRCGECVDETGDSIRAALEQIRGEYETYSSESRRLFGSVDATKVVSQILGSMGFIDDDREYSLSGNV